MALSLQSSLGSKFQITSPFRSTETATKTKTETVTVTGTGITCDHIVKSTPTKFYKTTTHSGIRFLKGEREREVLKRRAVAAEKDETVAEEDERRAIDKSEIIQEDPYGPVEAAMTSQVVTTREDVTLDSLLPLFEHFTGIPVEDESGKCVGVISNIDVAKYARGRADSLPTTTVREVMTSPAFVILQHAPVAYAAALMLKHKVHRLPVVDSNGKIVGIVTRTDLFEPLLPKGDSMYSRLVGHKSASRLDNL